jgi:hypothetical protein
VAGFDLVMALVCSLRVLALHMFWH